MAYSGEFTPEITDEFYNRLAARARQRGAESEGRAISEVLSRGLEGSPLEASLVGSAREATNRELGDLDASLAFQVAGMGREERLGRERRGWQVEDRDFSSREAEKDRSAAREARDWQGDMAARQNRWSQQAALWQLPFQIGGTALGGSLGRGRR